VIVALLVLTVGLLSTISTFAATARNYEFSHASVAASVEAVELLEFARVRGCGGMPAGAEDRGTGVFFWRTQDVGSDLQLITVVYSPRALRSRADTFSAFLPC
jgi:hypothetical protein